MRRLAGLRDSAQGMLGARSTQLGTDLEALVLLNLWSQCSCNHAWPPRHQGAGRLKQTAVTMAVFAFRVSN